MKLAHLLICIVMLVGGPSLPPFALTAKLDNRERLLKIAQKELNTAFLLVP
jgi:hypothetical protein